MSSSIGAQPYPYLISLLATLSCPSLLLSVRDMTHSSVKKSLESLLVSSEKAVTTAEEALVQAKTVLEQAKLTLAMLLTVEESQQPKEGSSLASGKKKKKKRKPKASKASEDHEANDGVERAEKIVSNEESGEENIVFLSDPAAEIVDVDDGPGGGGTRPGGGSSKTTAASVVLTSTGPSAEYRGNFLGVFDYLIPVPVVGRRCK